MALQQVVQSFFQVRAVLALHTNCFHLRVESPRCRCNGIQVSDYNIWYDPEFPRFIRPAIRANDERLPLQQQLHSFFWENFAVADNQRGASFSFSFWTSFHMIISQLSSYADNITSLRGRKEKIGNSRLHVQHVEEIAHFAPKSQVGASDSGKFIKRFKIEHRIGVVLI